MERFPRGAVAMFVAVCLVWHALSAVHHYRSAHRDPTARDFASYYYAVRVALEGGDPYDKASLGGAAREEATRAGVHPFFYPPPYLLSMLWVAPLDLVTAYRVWYWLDALCGLAAFYALWRWWQPLGPAVGIALAASLAALTALPNNHLMGQMNLPVLLLVVLGLAAAERGREGLGGVLLGVACMMKMSPALFVAAWLLRGRVRPVAAAVGTAVVLTVLSLPLVDAAAQLRFYTEVLPGFGSGRYNGLAVGIDLYGNHSLPNVWDTMFPGGEAHLVLSSVARTLSTLTVLGVLGVTAWLLRRPPVDGLARAAETAAIGCAMLLVPVYTYEHHLVWALPAVVVLAVASARGRVGVGVSALFGAAAAVWAFELSELKELALYIQAASPLSAALVRESKLAALLVLWVGSLVVARAAPGEAE